MWSNNSIIWVLPWESDQFLAQSNHSIWLEVWIFVKVLHLAASINMASWLKYHIVFEGEWGSIGNLGEPKKLYQNWEKGLGICFYFFDFLYFWEIWQIIDFCYQVKVHLNLHCITTTRAKHPMGVVFIGGDPSTYTSNGISSTRLGRWVPLGQRSGRGGKDYAHTTPPTKMMW